MTKKDDMLEDIREYEQDIKAREARIKTLKEDLTEKIDGTAAAEEVGRLKDQLKTAQENLRQTLQRNREVNDLMEEIGAEQEVLKGLKFSLSNHLVAYSLLTKERQVQMDDEGHSRDILMTAKLGKDEKNYQTSLIAPNDDVQTALDEFKPEDAVA
jgi:methyl-accepting chemotaxis protein